MNCRMIFENRVEIFRNSDRTCFLRGSGKPSKLEFRSTFQQNQMQLKAKAAPLFKSICALVLSSDHRAAWASLQKVFHEVISVVVA
mmetsp:Transcript_76732/g.153982  ORF Transcript_76732/g.153982 Transcript_76732/m.153982 type:complete len:86 (-) Transcript_76732:244-501(-)